MPEPVEVERTVPFQVQVQLCLDLRAGRQIAAEAGRRWFQLGFDLCGHKLRDKIRDAAVSNTYLGIEKDRRVEGNVGAMCGGSRITETARENGLRPTRRGPGAGSLTVSAAVGWRVAERHHLGNRPAVATMDALAGTPDAYN